MRIRCLVSIVLLGLAIMVAAQSPAGNVSKDKITAIAHSPSIPLLARLESNPLLCIKIYMPAAKKEVSFKQLHYTLNTEGVKLIERLDVFSNGGEPLFSANRPNISIAPSGTVSSMPIDIRVTPGWNYIWISAFLRNNVNTGGKVELHATKLVDSENKAQLIQEQKGNYKKYTGVAVRKAWDDSVHTYRIPGIVTTDKGTLLGVYDIRYKHAGDLPANVDVGLSRSVDGGRTWEPMKIIMDMGAPHENNGIGDPAILFDPTTKTIWVAALWSKGNRSIAGSEPGLSPDTTGQFVLVSSNDDGLTWSQPVSITSQVKDPKWHLYFNGPGNGITMKNGTLVFASQYWDESKKPGMPHSALIYSEDHGKTWKSGTGAKPNTTEAQIVETTPGTLMLNMRDNRGTFRSVATTNDLGKTWTEHPTSYNALQDPVCMASFIKASVKVKGQMKDVLFFSNVNSSTARVNMTIKASLDLGETWLSANELLIDERRSFGYSALTKIDDNTIGILYEGSRDIYFVRVPVSDIIQQK
jgi:sialidase-1